MLLNISNHPFETWPETQKDEAVRRWGEVQNLPFPHVDPELDDGGVLGIANKILDRVKELAPSAVIVAGEFSLTYVLVTWISELGIPCFVATTRREFDEEDRPVYRFVRFRRYTSWKGGLA